MRKQLSSRDEKILLLLKKFDFLTRDQLARYFKLGKKRNTNRILNDLSTYLCSIADGRHETIYYLNKLGREYVDCDKVRRKTGRVQHSVMRNDFWLYMKSPFDWKNEVKISDGETTVIADSMFSINGFKCFLEVDNLQTMKENRDKIARYKALMDGIERSFSYYPTLIWLTTTEHRRSQLETACEGLKFKVYTIDDIK